MRTLRVAVVAPSLDILGGQGVQAKLLVDKLAAEGHDVWLVPINPRFPRGLAWIRRVPYARTALNELLYLVHLGALARADVVHVFSASYWSFLLSPLPAMIAGRLLGKRVLLNYHSGEAGDHLGRWGALVHPWLRLADEIVVPSEYLRAAFARHGYRVSVIRNTVDTTTFRYRQRQELRPRLLSARNLEALYRIDNTIEAFALVRGRHPEATLTIAGYGSQEAALRRIAQRAGVAGIRFTGRVEREAMPALFAEADIFVNSSEVDNQPVSILEAFAAGVPVVSTATGAIAEMVRDGETGLTVPPGDPAALAKAVFRLLEDGELATRIACAARREVEQYTWSCCRDLWLAVYEGSGP